MSPGFRRALVALMLIIASATATSGATYTAHSDNDQAFTAALDFGVHVSMNAVTSPLRGTVNVYATASETAGGTITQVVIQRSPAGNGTWTNICTDNDGAPWQCSWNTTGVANGPYDLRARATNNNGYSRTSGTVTSRLVDNEYPSVQMTDPAAGGWFSGTLTLGTTSVSDGGGSGLATVRYEYKLSSAGTWSTACSASSSPWTCSFNTASLNEAQNYDFRAVAIDGAGNDTFSTAHTNRRPDHSDPTGSLDAPLANIRGTVGLTGSASDSGSGVASVAVQYAPTGTSSWSQACVDLTTPFTSCNWDTTVPADGPYDLRAIVTDVAGKTFTTATRANHRVDNTLPTSSLNVPAGILSGASVNLTATATDDFGSGVKDVLFQRSPSGTGTWTDVCTPADAVSPYACTLNSTTLAEGLYDFRATATDNALNQRQSTTETRRVDNLVPSPVDVQSTNGGALAGRIEAGDTLTFTYSEEIDPATILAGWNGSAQPMFLAFTHAGSGDRIAFYGPDPYPLLPFGPNPALDLKADFVPNGGTNFNGTMTKNGASITITVGAFASGVAPNTGQAAARDMVWTPSNLVKDYANKAVSPTTAKTETNSGTADRDF